MNVKIFAKHLKKNFFYLINDHMYLNNIWGVFNSIIKKVAILKSVALLSSKWHE